MANVTQDSAVNSSTSSSVFLINSTLQEEEFWPHGYPLGGPHFLTRHKLVASIFIIISVVASVNGTLGNLGVLLIILLNKTMKNARSVFLVNLAFADLLVTTIALPFGIIGMVLGKEYFDSKPELCDFLGTLCITACVTALFSIGGIGFNRYFNICHPAIYPKIFSARNNIILCGCYWLIGIAMSLPSLVGWTKNVYDHKYLECIWDRLHSFSYTVFFSLTVVATPVAIISFSFLKIYLHVRASKRRVNAIQKETEGGHQNGSSTKENKKPDGSIKLARTLFFIFGVFVVCWTPYATLVIVDWKDQCSMEVHLFILLLAHMHAALNPLVYFLTNSHFKFGFQRIAGALCCSKPVVPNLPEISHSKRPSKPDSPT